MSKLPAHGAFDSADRLGRDTLNAIQARQRGNADVRALLVEIKRLHGVINSVEQLRQAIENAWREEVKGQLAALYQLRRTLADEPCIRARQAGLEPTTAPGAPKILE